MMNMWYIRGRMSATGEGCYCRSSSVADDAVVTVEQVHDTCIFNVGTIASTSGTTTTTTND